MALDFFGNVIAGGSGLSPLGWAMAGSSLFSTALGYSNAEQNRSLQRSMSNTAYQRSMADMRAAGLNPILGAAKGGGASTPAGSAMAAAENPMSSALAMKRQNAEIDNIKAQTELTRNKKETIDPISQIMGIISKLIEGPEKDIGEKIPGGYEKLKELHKKMPEAFESIIKDAQKDVGKFAGDSAKGLNRKTGELKEFYKNSGKQLQSDFDKLIKSITGRYKYLKYKDQKKRRSIGK